MIENKTLIGSSVAAIIILLGSMGYILTDKTYYSAEKGIIMECMRFSESGLRCYPELTTTKGYKDASDWVKLSDYVEQNGPPESPKQWLCNQIECVPL